MGRLSGCDKSTNQSRGKTMICKECKKRTISPTAKSWENGICNKCHLKKNPKLKQLVLAPEQVRLKTNPVDIYLDRGTLYELEHLDK